MTNFFCIPVTDEVLEDLKAAKGDPVTVKPAAFTEESNGFFLILSEVTVLCPDEEKGRDTVAGTIVLSRFNNDLQLIEQHSFTEFYEEIHSVYCRHEGSLISLPSGEIIYTTSLNRAYVFDKEGKSIIKRYNRKLKSFLSKKDNFESLNVDDPGELLKENFITRGARCPHTGRLLALVDTLAAEQVSERRMRGEVLAVSKEPYTDYSIQPELELLHVFNDEFKGSLKKDQAVPFVKTAGGSPLTLISWPKDPLVKKLKEKGHNLLTGVLWTGQPLAMGKGFFFLPVYMEMLRTGGKGYPFFGFIMNEKGDFLHDLKGFDFREDSVYTKEQFSFAVSRKEERIFHKNDYGIYLFDYKGNLLEKYYFSDEEVKPLRPYRLFGSLPDGRIIFFHEKNLDFLLFSPVLEAGGLKASITESIEQFKKEKSKAKKEYFYENRCWFTKVG